MNQTKLKPRLLESLEQDPYHRSGRPCQLVCKTWATSLRVSIKPNDGMFKPLTKCLKRLISTRIWQMGWWVTFSTSTIYFERVKHTPTSKRLGYQLCTKQGKRYTFVKQMSPPALFVFSTQSRANSYSNSPVVISSTKIASSPGSKSLRSVQIVDMILLQGNHDFNELADE